MSGVQNPAPQKRYLLQDFNLPSRQSCASQKVYPLQEPQRGWGVCCNLRGLHQGRLKALQVPLV
jgi:hypothetical protein